MEERGEGAEEPRVDDRLGGKPLMALIAGMALFVVGVGVLLALQGGEDGEGDPLGAASSEASAEVGAVPGGVATAVPAPSTSARPSVSSESPRLGNSLAPATGTTYVGEGLPDPDSLSDGGFTATSDRKPGERDADRARDLMGRVVPRWASNETSGGNNYAAWAKSWEGEEGVSASFKTVSNERFVDLWGGLSRMRASVVDAKIVGERELWNVGSHALWRVDIERRVVSNQGRAEVESKEKVSWDFLLSQSDDKAELVEFAETRKANEKPETFYTHGEVQ